MLYTGMGDAGKSVILAFGKECGNLISNHFPGVRPTTNLKPHYCPLRNNKPPYDCLPSPDRRILEQDVFDIINRLDCALVSATIDLSSYERHQWPASPRTYSLLPPERFQYFLEDKDSRGVAICGRFGAKMRKKAELEAKPLQSNPAFPNTASLNRIRRRVLRRSHRRTDSKPCRLCIPAVHPSGERE